MRDPALDYILHVLEKKDWSANRLAVEAGVAASTINRPLREPEWKHKISRGTISKIAAASGIDPSPWVPEVGGFAEGQADYTKTAIGRALSRLDKDEDGPNAQARNEIKIALVGPLAQIVATIDREGIAKLRKKLDQIESMLDD